MKERGWADDNCGRRVSLAQAGEYLCHESMQVTKHYTHLTESHTQQIVKSMNEKIFATH
jgi:hypothetical protein